MKRIENPGVSMVLTGGVFALPAPAQDFPPVEMEIIQLNDRAGTRRFINERL